MHTHIYIHTHMYVYIFFKQQWVLCMSQFFLIEHLFSGGFIITMGLSMDQVSYSRDSCLYLTILVPQFSLSGGHLIRTYIYVRYTGLVMNLYLSKKLFTLV